MLSPTQLAARDGKITASFLPKLMAGDNDAILNEWRRVVGDPEWVPENLDDSWPVQFGSFIEPFALDWHEHKTGQILSRRGEVVTSLQRPYFCCTLDAYRADDRTVIDCKAPGQWRKVDDVLAYYVPQLVGQKACVGADRAALLVVHGGSEPQEYPIEWDANYEAEVWRRVDHFQNCVEFLTPPVALPPVAAPVKAEKTYDFATNNHWVSEAAAWLQNRQAAKDFSAAEKQLKSIVPADAACVTGGGISCRRDKSNRLSIREIV